MPNIMKKHQQPPWAFFFVGRFVIAGRGAETVPDNIADPAKATRGLYAPILI